MMMTDNAHTKIYSAVQEAPLLSESASRLLQITANPDYDVDEVLTVIHSDAALTARLLRTVNSAVYRRLIPITSVDRAVSQLGTRMVVGLAIADSAEEIFSAPLTGYEGHPAGLYRHNLFCALAARAIARFGRNRVDAELAFTGGLLHDIGKAILSQFLVGTSRQMVTAIEAGAESDYLATEHQQLGLSHPEVGEKLARHWRLPPPLPEIIRHHHQPRQAPPEYQALVYAVHLGDVLAMMGGHGTGSDSLRYHLDNGFQQHYNLQEEDLEIILLKVGDEFEKIAGALNILPDAPEETQE